MNAQPERIDRRVRRMQRPEFEALLLELGPMSSPGEGRKRLAAHEAIMAAFDNATGRRPYRAQRPDLNVRGAAEALRLYAELVNGDTDITRRAHCDALEAALDSLPPGWWRDHCDSERRDDVA